MIDKYCNQDIGIFHILYVKDERAKNGHKIYHIRCNYCGKEFDKEYRHIKKAQTCKHIHNNWDNARLGKIYNSMLNRCYNTKDKSFRFYGAKGINVCSEWLNNAKTFEKWALENGYKENLTIDRIDSLKNYSPENCHWISFEDNSRWKGNTNRISIGDENLTGRQWADKLNLGTNTINTYIRNYGLENTKNLIKAMLKNPNQHRKSHQTWFDVYKID